jgi:hypothetical protein
VHFIASWNLKQDPHAFRYIDEHHPDTWTIFCDTTFRGWYMGGEQGGDLDNKTFVERHAKDHGALGDYFAPLKEGAIKMGDTPSVAFLLRGDPNDPTRDSWGGRFIAKEGRPRWWVDDPNPAWVEKDRPGAKTVNRWREDYLRDFERRLDRCLDNQPSLSFTSWRATGRRFASALLHGYAWTDWYSRFSHPPSWTNSCRSLHGRRRWTLHWLTSLERKRDWYASSNDLIHCQQKTSRLGTRTDPTNLGARGGVYDEHRTIHHFWRPPSDRFPARRARQGQPRCIGHDE